MEQSLRIVTHLPLRELWRDDGFNTASRVRDLDGEEITELLRSGPVQFVVVDIGSAPRWIALSDCYLFWKGEAKMHVVALGSRVVLEEFPGRCYYFASEWEGGLPAPIVVLERCH
jgi:hypothetical protein